MAAALVVGADGLIGGELLRHLRNRGWDVVGTARRSVADDAAVRFDLLDAPAELLNASAVRRLRSEETWVAFMAAGITGYARCAQDPVQTHRVNVTSTITLAANLVKSAAFVVYLSSSAVFGKSTGLSHESSIPSATSEYGRQKADAEQGMLCLNGQAPNGGGVAVVRLTKVVSARGLVGKWIDTLRGGGSIDAATDLHFCPISPAFAAQGLIAIAATRRSGVYHLSGESAMSYFEFALRMADALGVPRNRVHPAKIGRHSLPGAASGIALQMSETSRYAPVLPQTLDSVLLELVSSEAI